MALLPGNKRAEIRRIKEIQLNPQPSKTWKIDWQTNTVEGMTDGNQAMRQAIMLALQIPRYEHLIYSSKYGSELHTLIGEDVDVLKSEAERMITEALTIDERIKEVRDFLISVEDGVMVINFVVKTIFGNSVEEVRIGV